MTPDVNQKLSQAENYAVFHRTWQFFKFIHLPFKIVGLFCGNQSFKTSGSMYQYVLRCTI